MLVKVCCIQNVEEARLCFDLGVDMIGLVADMPSGFRMLEDIQIKEIIEKIDFKISKVLLTSRTKHQDIIAHLKYTKADMVQIVDSVEPLTHSKIKDALPHVKTIQVVHVEDDSAVIEARLFQDVADYILLDSGTPKSKNKTKILGGTGNTHNWDISKQIVASITAPIILAGGLNPDNIVDALSTVQPIGVDVCSGLREPKYLIKDKLQKFTLLAKK